MVLEVLRGILVAGALTAAMWLAVTLGQRVLGRLAARTATRLDDQLLQAGRAPLIWLGSLWGARMGVEQVGFLGPETLLGFLLREGLYLGQLGVLLLLSIRLVNTSAGYYQRHIAPHTETTLDEQVMPFLRRIVVILLVAGYVVVALEHFGQPIGPVLASLGVASLAVALAARSTLEDVIAGIILMFDRPFRIGDRIELAGLNLVGDVADIGLRSTRVRTRDNRLIVVPNSRIANNLLVNLSFPDPTLRLQVDVGVDYGSDVSRVREVALQAMASCQGVLAEPPPQALFLGFQESSLLIRARYWIPSYSDWRRMQDRVNQALLEAFRREGISIPFPIRTLHLEAEARALLGSERAGHGQAGSG